jgi:hypothetical protein
VERLCYEDLAKKYGASFVQNACLTSTKFRYVYVINYRCGSSSIRDALVQLERFGTIAAVLSADDPRSAARETLLRVFDNSMSRQSHATSAESFWFSIVRHPVTRIVSAYESKILPRLSQEGRIRQWLVKKRVKVGDSISFDEFLLYLEHTDFRRVDKHWWPQKHLLMYDDIRYDYVGRFEKFRSEMILIFDRIGIFEQHIPWLNLRPTKATVVNGLSASQLSRIYRLFQADFDCFKCARLPPR